MGNIGSYTSVPGCEPHRFQFHDDVARVQAEESRLQEVINRFKEWLPNANRGYKRAVEDYARRVEVAARQKLQRQAEEEERRLRALQNLKV